MKLSSSGDAYFSIESNSDTSNTKNIKKDNKDINHLNNYTDLNREENKKQKTEISLTEEKYESCESLESDERNSAPNTPTRITTSLESIAIDEEMVTGDENIQNNIQVPEFQVQESNFTPFISNDFILLDKEIIVNDGNYPSKLLQVPDKLLFKSVEISNCHSEILKSPDKAEEIFYKHIIKKEEFFKDPWKVLNNSNLIILYEENLYTYKSAVPFLFSLMIYGENLPTKILNELNKEKSLFGFLRSKKKNELSNIKVHHEQKELDHESKRKNSVYNYKSFSPTSSQLERLGLKYGHNEISFVCKSRLSGKQVLKSDIFLWESTSKIVISDIDGTITKSDVLGQIMPIIGKDWSHTGVAELYTNIEKNGYKMLYLTSRALCQSSLTKKYIQNLFQSNI